MLTHSLYAKEIRLFNLGILFSRRFRQLRQQLYRESLQIATKRSLQSLVTQVSATLASMVPMPSSLTKPFKALLL
jgi:ATP-binding cassette subfamily B protein